MVQDNPIHRYTKLLARGYYKLTTVLVVVGMMLAMFLLAIRLLWVFPAESDPIELRETGIELQPREVPVEDRWELDDVLERTDMASRYRIYNAKLNDMVARGGMSPMVAADARRDQNVFKREHDNWTDTAENDGSLEGAGAGPPTAFNPKVTLTGT